MNRHQSDMPGTTTTDQSPDNMPKPRKKSRVVPIFVWMIAFPATIGTFAGFAGRMNWMIDLFNHARVQYLMALLVVVVLALIVKRWRTAIIFMIPFMVNVYFVAPFLPLAGDASDSQEAIRLVQFNVNTRGGDKAAIAAYLNASDAHIIFTQEVNIEWVNHLANTMTNYDLVKADPRSDNFGIAIFVQNGIDGISGEILVESSAITDISGGTAQVPAIDARVQFNGRAISILNVHTLPPVNDHYARGRDDGLAGIAAWANKQENPAIVIGDLNATPWSCPFRDMMAASGLHNSMTGRGLGMTWPAGQFGGLWLTMIPIDHCLHNDDLETVARWTGPNHGSDHRPLHVSLTARTRPAP